MLARSKIGLTILHQDGDTLVVFSYTASDAEYVQPHLLELETASGDFQKYLISKLVLRNCENFVLKPSYFFGLPEQQREALARFFAETALSDKPDFESEHLYLF